MTCAVIGAPSLRIFSDRGCLPPGVAHIEMLYPFWGNPRIPARDPIFGDFARYIAQGPTFFELTSLDTADVAVLPFDWEATFGNPAACDAACAFARRVGAAGKPLVVFFFSDMDDPVPLPATVLRASISRSSHGAREFAMPLWNEDIVEWFCGGRLPVRARPTTPIVGFCGRVPSRNLIRTALAGVIRRPVWRGTRGLRAAAIDGLRKSSRVEARVTERRPYFGHLVASVRTADQARVQRCRLEFVDHLIGSDYALCLRGVGHNYSYRVGEALCCGRIPVIVDSDILQPYEWEIDWRSYGIWVSPQELDHIGDRVADFNAALSDGAFIELQHEGRRLWEDRLSPEGFFRNFHRHFGPCAPAME